MSGPFSAVKISDRVYWVGAIDWALRDFHGYATSMGSTYNAYLIVADQITLVDTVKESLMNEMMARIASVIDPSDIQNIVCNHAEMDHSGLLPRMIREVRPERVIASRQGVKALNAHFHWDVQVEEVKDGECLDLGGARVHFVATPMLHWPDSMFSYLEGDRVLFSQDAFGMHLASGERFADELDAELLRQEAAKYYANILLPFSPMVTKLFAKLPSLNLDIGIIAPDHGPIWREKPEQILECYSEWATQRPTRKAVVVYDTMWYSTARMAEAVSEGLASGGLTVKMMPLAGSHRSDVATELLEAGTLVVGSPTINGMIYPTVADVLTYIRGLKPKNLIGAAFGSYGWTGESIGQVEEYLTEINVEIAAERVRVQYVPDSDALMRCHALGRQVAAKRKESLTAGVSS
ncbi:FprA family A-type flavoprotein [Candidatus Eisenbacteria bacterium]|uniref:FprA family A-type flavoprotein n=1 Tax=Eiseniibacteriota bacterium TaxID=2212470 RepID=A0ABV6YKN6_UNCEI